MYDVVRAQTKVHNLIHECSNAQDNMVMKALVGLVLSLMQVQE